MEHLVRIHRILAVFIPQWESLTTRMGTDRYVRLQTLLTAIPTDTPDRVLSRILCPVFAVSESDQELFYDHFGQLAADFDVPELSVNAAPPEEDVFLQPDGKQVSPPPVTPPAPAPSSPALPAPTPERRSNKFILDYENATSPPVTWNIVPESDQKKPLDAGERFRKTMLQLRQREYAQNQELDIPATIKATIRQAGMPNFQFRLRTRPAEYLLLVERFSTNDHRAALFDNLYKTLKTNEVLTERFFYNGDLYLFRNERHPEGLYLHELYHRYPDSRLLILGAGYRLISPVNGRLNRAAKTLQRWNTRLLLTPIVREKWGGRERLLSKVFTLLPAAVESLQFAAEHQGGSVTAYDRLPDYLRSIAEAEPISVEGNTMRLLRRHFDTWQLRWIAACAIYPGLYYNLTLFIGRVLEQKAGYSLVNAANLLKLARLPWFTQGRIPKEIRQELINYLYRQLPELHQAVLTALTALMDKNPPPKESIAWAAHNINLALWKWQSGQHPDEQVLEDLREFLTVKAVQEIREGDFPVPEGWVEKVMGERLAETEEVAELPIQPSVTDEETTKSEPLHVIITFVHEDRKYVKECRKYLQPLVDSNLITVWDETQIFPGAEWRKEIEENVEKADIIIVFLSPDYIATPFTHSFSLSIVETNDLAIKRSKEGKVKIWPILIRKCAWEKSAFAQFQLFNSNSPVYEYEDSGYVWGELAIALERLTNVTSVVRLRDNNIKKPLKTFIIYDRKDSSYKEELLHHLSPLIRSGHIDVWHDGLLEAGENWAASIKQNLLESDLVLLLVSIDLLDDFIYDKLEIIIQEHNKGASKILPILVRPVDTQGLSIVDKLEILPKVYDDKFLNIYEWSDRNNAWFSIIKEIEKQVLGIAAESQRAVEPIIPTLTVLIFAPLPVEYAAMRKHINDIQPPVYHHGTAYEVGIFKGKHHIYKVVLREPGMYNEEMALATEQAIQQFQPHIALLVGIAGAVKDVAIGDVVVANKTYGYEYGKEDENGFKTRPIVSTMSIELLARCQMLMRNNQWKQRIKIKHPLSASARIFIGPVAAGNKVVTVPDNESFQRIKRHYNDTLALEMETIGFATALQNHPSIHGLAIRGISDLIINSPTFGTFAAQSENAQNVAADHAAAVAIELLLNLESLPEVALPNMCIIDNRVYKRLSSSKIQASSNLLYLNEQEGILTDPAIKNFIAHCNYLVVHVSFAERWIVVSNSKIEVGELKAKSYDLFIQQAILPLINEANKDFHIIFTSARAENPALSELLNYIKYETYKFWVSFLPITSILGAVEEYTKKSDSANTGILIQSIIDLPSDFSKKIDLLPPAFEDRLGWVFSDQNEAWIEYKKYVEIFPNGLFINEAHERIRDIEGGEFREKLLWSLTNRNNSVIAHEEYLKLYPNGRYSDESRSKLEYLWKLRKTFTGILPKIFVCYDGDNTSVSYDFIKKFGEQYGHDNMELLLDGTVYSGNFYDRFNSFAQECDIAILLINAKFTNFQSYTSKYEIPILLERQKRDEVTIVGVLFSDVDILEWSKNGDIYFFQLRNNDLVQSKIKDKNAELLQNQFTVYETIEKKDSYTYHKKLVEWVKEVDLRRVIIKYNSVITEKSAEDHIIFLNHMGERIADVNSANFQIAILKEMSLTIKKIIDDLVSRRHKSIDKAIFSAIEDILDLNLSLVHTSGSYNSSDWMKIFGNYIKMLKKL
jgi:nucleoside phosphorylase